MKKILAVIFAALTIGICASAEDITFTPEGGGRWIYCNNPEGIRNQDLMNSDENPPSYIMNNENLGPDVYDFLLCHINCTDSNGGYGIGYDIEMDVELTALEDSEITINKSFFETADDSAFIFGDGTWDKEMNKVGCLRSLASYLGVNLAELNGSWLYEAEAYEPVTIEVKKGETVWLSEYTNNYDTVAYKKPVQIIGQIVINSGKMNFNVAAFKSGKEIGDRTGFDKNAAFGKYAYTRTQKGIADTLPKVNANLEYTIDYSMRNGDYYKNRVYNQYEKEGNITEVWCTHLNPQDDIWSKSIAAQSDLITLKYEDDSKLEYYGSRVKQNKKDNVWVWDPFHSDTAGYEGAVTWYEPDEYMPNYPLSPNRSNQGYACSMGNYGVVEAYNLKVKNITDADKYFEYDVETRSNVTVYVEDEDGVHSGLLKGETAYATKNTMASVKIPAKSEKEFTINLVLPINYVGGIRNSFKVSDKTSIENYYEDFLDRETAQEGPITKGVIAREVQDKLPQEVKEIINGNYDHFELIESDNGYMLRWMAWDGEPYYYMNDWVMAKTLYFLDKKYGLVSKYNFDNLVQLALYYDGYYYVEEANGVRHKSKDGQTWEDYTKRLPLSDIEFNNSVPSKWAEKEIRRAYEIDVAPYDLKDKLEYTDGMTREIFCYVLSSMLELKDQMPEETGPEFSDTTSKTISKFAKAGIISGYGDGTFRPKKTITRAEAAMLLYRTAKYLEYNDFYDDYKLSDYVYADDDEIGDWAREAVYQMNKTKIMTGVGNDMFEPSEKYTNEQSIATILRLYDAV